MHNLGGTVHGKNGLLLIKYKDIDRPRRFCGLSIDFGSTHTRAFRIECEANGEARANAEVEVLRMASGVHDLTRTDPGQIGYYFFSWESHDELFDAEINSQMLIPYPNHENPQDWLPREGHAFRHSIYYGFPPMDLRFNLKWNTSSDNSELRAFLRCLTLRSTAQCVRDGFTPLSIGHSYPSIFRGTYLEQKHNDEWLALGRLLGERGALRDATAPRSASEAGNSVSQGIRGLQPLMEAEAVARHLQLD